MHPGAIVLRAVLAYLFLLALVRVSGTRTIRQVTPLDFCVALILSDLVDDMLWAEVPVARFVAAVATLFLAAIIVTLLTRRYPAAERFILGRSVELVRDGAPVPENCQTERISEARLMALLRQGGIDDLRQVKHLSLETHGQPGIICRPWARTAQKQDLPRLEAGEGER